MSLAKYILDAALGGLVGTALMYLWFLYDPLRFIQPTPIAYIEFVSKKDVVKA